MIGSVIVCHKRFETCAEGIVLQMEFQFRSGWRETAVCISVCSLFVCKNYLMSVRQKCDFIGADIEYTGVNILVL